MVMKRTVAIESSGVAVKSLRTNIEDCWVENVEIISRNWLEIGEREIGGGFDLAGCVAANTLTLYTLRKCALSAPTTP